MHDQQYKSWGSNHMTSDMLEEERFPWGEVFVFSVLPFDRHLGLSALLIFRTWPITLALLTPTTDMAGKAHVLERITPQNLGIPDYCHSLW